MLETFLLIVGISFCITYLLKGYFNYWKNRGFPYLEPDSIVGHLPGFFFMKQYIGDAYNDIYKKMSGFKVAGIFHMFKPILLIMDPEEIRNFLTKDFSHFPIRDIQLDTELEITGYNLFFNQDNESWKYLRGKLSKLFSSSKLKSMFKESLVCNAKFHKQLAKCAGETSFDLRTLMSDYMTDITFSCFFGLNTNLLNDSAEEGAELRRLGSLFVEPTLTTMVHGFLSGLPGQLQLLFKIPILPKKISNYFLSMVNELEEFRDKNVYNRQDLFHELMEIKKLNQEYTTEKSWGMHAVRKEKLPINKFNIAAQCAVFYAAGFETSSFTVCSCLHVLAYHPDIQDKACQEVQQVLKEFNGEFSYECLKELKYLDMVISETLRLFPPVPELMRKCSKAYRTTEGLLVEPGTRVVVPVHALHRDPAYYPEPLSFRPERFAAQPPPQYAYLPFGAGPRSCIGMRFGQIQVKLGVASVLAKYTIQPDTRSPYPPNYSAPIFVSAHNQDGFWLKLTPRDTQ